MTEHELDPGETLEDATTVEEEDEEVNDETRKSLVGPELDEDEDLWPEEESA